MTKLNLTASSCSRGSTFRASANPQRTLCRQLRCARLQRCRNAGRQARCQVLSLFDSWRTAALQETALSVHGRAGERSEPERAGPGDRFTGAEDRDGAVSRLGARLTGDRRGRRQAQAAAPVAVAAGNCASALRLPGQVLLACHRLQRLPALLNEVHRLIEARGLRFALLGSSARKLKAAGTNLLAGRALKKTMFPLTAAELGEDFDLDRVLQYGSVPLVWSSGEPREVLEAYGQLYLREEIRAEALVRNLPGFVRFLPVAALVTVNASCIASTSRAGDISRFSATIPSEAAINRE